MTDTPAHTPLPWAITRAPSGRPYSIHSLSPEDLNSQPGRVGAQILRWGSFMLPSSAEAEANAAFIVRACNSHYALASALRGLLDEIAKSPCADSILDSSAAGHAFAALSQAGGASE